MPSRSVIVRQTPLTEMESPTEVSAETAGASASRRLPRAAWTRPRSSTIPVNIRHHLQVVSDAADLNHFDTVRLRDARDAVAHQHAGGLASAHEDRGDEQNELVHKAEANRLPRQRRAAFDE